eukprot:627895-Alexandrium_andersonii.AAC.1
MPVVAIPVPMRAPLRINLTPVHTCESAPKHEPQLRPKPHSSHPKKHSKAVMRRGISDTGRRRRAAARLGPLCILPTKLLLLRSGQCRFGDELIRQASPLS